MEYTPLQKVALAQAEVLAGSLGGAIHSLSRTYQFAGRLCERNTPENDLLKDVEMLREIIRALRAEH